jgi:hypothetical protein
MLTPTEKVGIKSRTGALARLLHPFGTRVRTLGALELSGYFDEGGTHAQSQVIVLAGYVRPAVDWEPFEQAWKTVLAEEEAPFYHTTDIEAHHPRGIYEDWTRAKADKLISRIMPLAAPLADCVVAFHILTEDWLVAADFLKSTLENKPHRLPYEILTKVCLDLVIELAANLPASESVAFVFEDNDYSSSVLNGYQIVKRLHPQSHRLGILAFEPNKSRWAALQAADLLALPCTPKTQPIMR